MDRRFDAEGRIRDCWTQVDTYERFVERSDRLVEAVQDQFCPFENECVNGRVALGRE